MAIKQPKRTDRQRTKLEALMRDMTKEERLAVMAKAGYSPETWWKWANKPRTIPTGALVLLMVFLEGKHGKAIPYSTLLEPYSLV